MRTVTFTIERLKRMNRPAEYLDDLRTTAAELGWGVALGDTIAFITSSVGIKPCGGCKERQEMLNKLLPYKP